jgi:hypothetical protein
MATADEQVIVGGQRAVAVNEVGGSYLYDGGATDIQCVVKDGDKAQRAIKVVNLDGGGQPLFNKIIIKDSVNPTASSSNAGAVYMYVGETNDNYVHGFIYENRYVPNYSGTITFSPAGISVSDENFSSFLNKWKQYLTTPTLVTNGTITYHGSSAIWKMVMKDANNQQIGTLQLYQSDYEDSGFTFPADPQDGDEYTFTTTITESSSSYQWVRTDVQPGGGTVKFVPELPAQGEERYIYGVVREETTRDGYGIIQLFMWYNDNWRAAGAYDVDIDPSQLVYKDNIPYATSTKVGGIKQEFDATTGTWTVTTDNI